MIFSILLSKSSDIGLKIEHSRGMDLDLFFPIAGLSFNALTILAVGLAGGIVSSGLGIGSGVVVTPALLMLIGVPPFVAVTSQMGNAIGVNLMGFLGYWRKRDVDFGLGFYLFIGGVLGAFTEIWLLHRVRQGSASQNMALIYIVVLGVLATLLLVQSIRAFFESKSSEKSVMMRHWMIYFPWHKIFIRSRTEISILIPIFVGLGTGLLTSTLGGGNSLFMMPIISYLIGRVSPVVQGTTLFAGFMITTVVTIIHCFTHTPFDLVLVFMLLVGGTLGSKLGFFLSYIFPRQCLGLLGALVIYLISAKFAFDLWGGASAKLGIVSPTMPLDVVPLNQSWTIFLSDFMQNSLMAYIVTGIFSIILVAIVLEKMLQRTLNFFSKRFL